jgi:hypothetical protein
MLGLLPAGFIFYLDQNPQAEAYATFGLKCFEKSS